MEPKLITERYQNSFEKHLGVEFLEYSEGKCSIKLIVKNYHLNIGNSAHGGIINGLCDIALSGAVTSNFNSGAEAVVTMDMNVSFLRPGFEGDTLIAFGEVIKAGKTICYVEGGVKNQEDKLIARATGNWFVKRK